MDYLKLMRVKHYIKNTLVFFPLFFSLSLFDMEKTRIAFLGVVCFSMVSSAVYIFNDIRDAEKDRNHPTKKERPIASGRVSTKKAGLQMTFLMFAVIGVSIYIRNILGIILLLVYFGLNVAYSMGLKKLPIIDVVILASGFVIRVIYGGVICGIEISQWLYLVIVSGSLFMGLGKRRNELKMQKNTREVLKYYSISFLDKNMYVSGGMMLIFYSLWAKELMNPDMIWITPFFIVIFMRYSYDIEGESDGDPTEVILHDKILICLAVVYAVVIFMLLYII